MRVSNTEVILSLIVITIKDMLHLKFSFYYSFPTVKAMCTHWGFPDGSDGKESACSAGGPGSIPGLGISPGEGNGNPLQYSHLENAMDRGA